MTGCVEFSFNTDMINVESRTMHLFAAKSTTVICLNLSQLHGSSSKQREVTLVLMQKPISSIYKIPGLGFYSIQNESM